MRFLPLLCPILLALAFVDVLGGLNEAPAANVIEETLPTVQVEIDEQAAQPAARLRLQQDGSMQLILVVDGVEIQRNLVETTDGFAVAALQDI